MNKSLCLCALLATTHAVALDLDSIVSTQILPGWRNPDGTHIAALQINLAPGWKTYWRAPGDSGIPPKIEISHSSVSNAKFNWPTPEVFYTDGLRSVGYINDVVVPVELNGASNMTLKGNIDMGICDDICIPVTLNFEAELPLKGSRDGAIIAALLDQPTPLTSRPICHIRPLSDGLEVTFELPENIPLTSQVVIEAQTGIWVSEPETWQKDGQLMAQSDMHSEKTGPFALDRSKIRVTYLSDLGAYETLGCIGG